jgi:hypothetical protein
MRKAYQTRSSKVLPKAVSGSASEFIPVTYSVPQKMDLQGWGTASPFGILFWKLLNPKVQVIVEIRKKIYLKNNNNKINIQKLVGKILNCF